MEIGLYALCERAQSFDDSPEKLDEVWESIRQCLAAQPSIFDRQAAATHRGHDNVASIHLLCKARDPPLDIVEALVICSPETVEWQDSNGMLPLHHASANKASGGVLKLLVDAFPAGALAQEARQRTPLHFAFVQANDEVEDEFEVEFHEDGEKDAEENDQRHSVENSRADIVQLLSNNGAAELPDENGMLPMHYGCAYGNSESVLEILREAYPESIVAKENSGRTPLHLAMANAHRHTGPSVVGFLTRHGAETGIVDVPDSKGRLPLSVLSSVCKARAPMSERERLNASKCLALYLDARPEVSADFLDAMRETPDWLRDDAVLIRYGWREARADLKGEMLPFVVDSNPNTQSICFGDHYVREGINKVFIKRPVLAVMMCDLYCQILLVIAVSGANSKAAGQQGGGGAYVAVLILAVFWFALREIIQMSSSPFGRYITDAWNWVDLLQISLVIASLFSYTVAINPSRGLLTVTVGIVWFALLGVLKNFLYGVSVFLSSLQQILVALVPFMAVTAITVAAFVFMLHTSNANTNQCIVDIENDEDELAWYCGTLGQLFADLSAFVLSMKEIEIETGSTEAITNAVLYAFGFITALIFLNVLIAKISNVFSEVEERGDYFFWEDRVSILTEAESLLQRHEIAIRFMSSGCKKNSSSNVTRPRVLKSLQRALHHFDENPGSHNESKEQHTTDDFLQSEEVDRGDKATCRVVLFRLLVPLAHVCFFIAGCVSFGILWPKWMASAMFSGKYENFGDLKGDISNVETKVVANLKVLEKNIAGIKEVSRSNNEAVEERITGIEDALKRIEDTLGVLLDK